MNGAVRVGLSLRVHVVGLVHFHQRATNHVVFVKDLFGDRIGWPVVPTGIVFMIKLDSNDHAHTDVCASPPRSPAPKDLSDLELIVTQSLIKIARSRIDVNGLTRSDVGWTGGGPS